MTPWSEILRCAADPVLEGIIAANDKMSPADLSIKLSKLPMASRNFIAGQVRGRQVAAEKFPGLLAFPGIIDPPSVYLEQSSRESTARFKASLYGGKTAIDLTTGFGIDAWQLSGNFERMELVESDEFLHHLSEYNFKILGRKNIRCHNLSAEQFLPSIRNKADLLYLDPSRRSDGKRYFRPEESRPDFLKLLPSLRKSARRVLIKLSPMADITDLIKKAGLVSRLFILSDKGECREVLAETSEKVPGKTGIICREVDSDEESFSYFFGDEGGFATGGSRMKKYAYLPNASLSKAGCFGLIGKRSGANRISANTHIYTSEELLPAFPGRKFNVLASLKYSKVGLKAASTEEGFNIITRNFPHRPPEIAGSLDIGQSGSLYLFAYRNMDGKNELSLCQLIKT